MGENIIIYITNLKNNKPFFGYTVFINEIEKLKIEQITRNLEENNNNSNI